MTVEMYEMVVSQAIASNDEFVAAMQEMMTVLDRVPDTIQVDMIAYAIANRSCFFTEAQTEELLGGIREVMKFVKSEHMKRTH